MFQYRGNGSVNFYRNFADYRNGFGDMEGEFWLGKPMLSKLIEHLSGAIGKQVEMTVTSSIDTDIILFCAVCILITESSKISLTN